LYPVARHFLIPSLGSYSKILNHRPRADCHLLIRSLEIHSKIPNRRRRADCRFLIPSLESHSKIPNRLHPTARRPSTRHPGSSPHSDLPRTLACLDLQ
jgi:hypothetical protein